MSLRVFIPHGYEEVTKICHETIVAAVPARRSEENGSLMSLAAPVVWRQETVDRVACRHVTPSGRGTITIELGQNSHMSGAAFSHCRRAELRENCCEGRKSNAAALYHDHLLRSAQARPFNSILRRTPTLTRHPWFAGCHRGSPLLRW
jgi:hypothetical protein